jgi:predicted ATPase
MSRTAAVRLFVQRARAANQTLALTDDNAAAVARICISVDGIPLALELAAARLRVLTVEELLSDSKPTRRFGPHQSRRSAAAPDHPRHHRLEPRPFSWR